MKKRVITLALASLMIASPLLSVANAAPDEGESKAYINGYTPTEFKPDYKVTRAEISTMIAKKLGYPEANPSFTDITSKDSHWAGGFIGALTSKGILSGYTDGSFKPDASIARGELAKVLDGAYKAAAGSSASGTSTNLTDISGHWAETYIKNMESIKVLNGYSDKSFRPEDSLTREEAVTAINRLIRVIEKRADREYKFKFKVKSKFTDVDARRWSYAEVLDASTDYQYKKDGDKEVLVKTSKPEFEYRYVFSGNEVQNREKTIAVLNIKRQSEGIPAVKEDAKLNELSKRISSADAKEIRKDSIVGEELDSLMKTLGMTEKTAPQRGSMLFKTNSKSEMFVTDLIDETLLAGQYSRSFDRVGIASTSNTGTSYTSVVSYLGFKSSVDALDVIFDNEEAKDIFKSVQEK